MRLENKTAIITGGASGIGAACAQLFIQEGAQIAILDVDAERGEACVAGMEAGARANFYRCDVVAAAEVDSTVARIANDLGPPNVLVNNAGTAISGGLEELTEEQWDRQFAVNVKSIFHVSRRVIPLMRAVGGGSIINMASESAFIGFPMHPAYCASKAAIVQLSRSMAVRYAPDNIRVNALCPGTIDTELYRGFIAQQSDPQAVHDEVVGMHPLGIGQPQDVAWAALYLASDESRYTTGSPMLVDGGSTAL